MRSVVFFLTVLFFFEANASGGNTIIYTSAATPEGGQNVFVAEQPENAGNPFGDPLPLPNKPVEVWGDGVVSENLSSKMNNSSINSNNNATINNNEGQSNLSPQTLGNDFENTLLEANGRVYDIQSYPKDDFKVMGNPSNPATIYSPNVNN